MITRIEIDGFKSFDHFALDVPPFLALVGPNASGKSNLLDALEFAQASIIGDRDPFLDARRGKPHELFRRLGTGQSVENLTIKIWALADTETGVVPLRYQVSAAANDVQPGAWKIEQDFRLSLELEEFSSLSEAVRAQLYEQEQVWRKSTEPKTPESFVIERNLLSPIVDEPRSWRLHVPDPAAMRRSVPRADRRRLTENGGNLAAVLGRMAGSPELLELVVDLAALVPGVSGLEPVLNEREQEWSFDVIFEGQGAVPSRLVSEGTLRVVALLAAVWDPEARGVLMIEEIENGLHPSKLGELLRRLQQHVPDLRADEPLTLPLRQVILTTHSPVVVSELYRTRPDALMFLEAVSRVKPGHPTTQATVALPVRDEGEPGTYISSYRVERYLSTVLRAEP